jgi:ParB family chromosome partitioning protein
MAGLTEVPVRIIEADDKKATELALVENLQRADLNPMEEAEGYRTLMEEYGFTQEQVSERVGKSRSAVANALRLLALPEKLRALLETGELTPGHARAVLQVKGASAQEEFARLIVRDGLSVRKAEAMAAKISKETEKSKEKKEKTSKFEVNYIAELEKQLTECLGRRVKVVDGRKRGRLEIDYYGDDDLQTLIDMLTSKGK